MSLGGLVNTGPVETVLGWQDFLTEILHKYCQIHHCFG